MQLKQNLARPSYFVRVLGQKLLICICFGKLKTPHFPSEIFLTFKDVATRAIVDARLYFDMGVFYKAMGDIVVSM